MICRNRRKGRNDAPFKMEPKLGKLQQPVSKKAPPPSKLSQKLKSMLNMKPGHEQSTGLKRFFRENPVDKLDDPSRYALSVYFATGDVREITRRGDMLRSVMAESKDRSILYSTLRRNDLPGKPGRLARGVADRLLAYDKHAFFVL